MQEWIRGILAVTIIWLAVIALSGGLTLLASLGGCTTPSTHVLEADRGAVPPHLMVPPREAEPIAGEVPLAKHLRDEARERKERGEIADRLRDLQAHVDDEAGRETTGGAK